MKIKDYSLICINEDMKYSLLQIKGNLPILPITNPCKDCGGLCCRFMPFGIPGRYQDERDNLYNSLPKEWADYEVKYIEQNVKTSDNPIDLRDCLYLINGLCALQVSGHPKPRSCVEYEVNNEHCIKLRTNSGV